MRVVAGVAGGRRLRAPRGQVTRPTSDFVREAVFNSLASRLDLAGLCVVDLFAGSGALGIEALSRGAAEAVFVDRDQRAVESVRANLDSTGLGPAAVHRADLPGWLDRPGRRHFGLALVDPPYGWDGWPQLMAGLRAGLAVLESDRPIDPGPAWEVLAVKRLGGTVVTLTSPRSRP